jgi:hypothetical protein
VELFGGSGAGLGEYGVDRWIIAETYVMEDE